MKKLIVVTIAAVVIGFATSVAKGVRAELRGCQLPGD